MHPVHFGLKLSGQDTTIEALRTVWRIADESGFDHVWDFDHFASIGPAGPDRPIYEGWALQAAMAEATKRVRIGCMVSGNTYRNPAVLAKLAVTVDHLSGGRLEFGIGAAWAAIEHSMYGIDGLDHRVGRLSESLQIIRSLWTEERTNFEGRYYKMTDWRSPTPNRSRSRIRQSGSGRPGRTTIRLVARYADVWNTGTAEIDKGTEVITRLEDACGAVGRDPSEIRRSIQIVWDGAGPLSPARDALGALPRSWGSRSRFSCSTRSKRDDAGRQAGRCAV